MTAHGRVAILGAARSGLAAAELLKAQGYEVFVSEKRPENEVVHALEFLKQRAIDFEFDGHSNRVLQADFLVVSPGIPLNTEIIRQAQSRGLPVVSEVEVAFRYCPGPIVAVTGSNGKSTTTALIGAMFKAAGRKCMVTGNIGYPFSKAVLEMDPATTAVVELSSFQLESIDTFRPHIAVLLNLAPDHLDRHIRFANYRRLKARIFANQTPADFAVYNTSDANVCQALQEVEIKSRLIPFQVTRNARPALSLKTAI